MISTFCWALPHGIFASGKPSGFSRNLHYVFDEYSFFSEFWHNPQLQPLLIELMPQWIGALTPEGKSLAAANIPPFLLEQPMIKFPLFTAGEVSVEQVRDFIAACNALTYTP